MTRRLDIEATEILESENIPLIGRLIRIAPSKDIQDLCRQILKDRISDGNWFCEDSETLGDFDTAVYIHSDRRVVQDKVCVVCNRKRCRMQFKDCSHAVCSRCLYRICPCRGPNFEKLWAALHRNHEVGDISWPDLSQDICDFKMANDLIESSMTTLLQIGFEELAGFALTKKTLDGIESFCVSHIVLARLVQESIRLDKEVWQKWHVVAQNSSGTHSIISESLHFGCSTADINDDVLVRRLKDVLYSDLKPIRDEFESSSLTEFLDYIPNLSEALASIKGLADLRSKLGSINGT